MKIIFEPLFVNQLNSILSFIALDKKSASQKFKKELQKKIHLISTTPHMYRRSNYFESVDYRDLIYHGYTIIYKIEEEEILILEIFKWQSR